MNGEKRPESASRIPSALYPLSVALLWSAFCLKLYLEPFYRAAGAEALLIELTKVENPF